MIRAPGRVNLIGEHIDYAGLPVLPMAIDRTLTLHVRPRTDGRVCITSDLPSLGEREFEIVRTIPPYPYGDWGNYAKAAMQGLIDAGLEPVGFDARVTSNLPSAAGLSSSSALVVGTALAALAGGCDTPDPLPLASLLAKAEHYAGARGGGMDQAAILAGRAGHALRIAFDPLQVRYVRIPSGWSFVVAHSLVTAEKGGAARDTYNARRTAVERALDELGASAAGYPKLVADGSAEELIARAAGILGPELLGRFRHVITEAARVERAEAAMRSDDAAAFGRLMCESHESLRTDFEVSTEALDALVETAMTAGALGARVTGAGLGGFIIALVPSREHAEFLERLESSFYHPRGTRVDGSVLFTVQAADGARVLA